MTFLSGLQPILLQEGPSTADIERPEGVFTLPTILPCESSEATYVWQCMLKNFVGLGPVSTVLEL